MNFSSIDTLWILLCTVLVFLMQAGFTLLEVGLTRQKNAGNIVMKNIMDYSIGTMVFWIFGFGLMFASGNAFIGGFDFLTQGDYSGAYPSSTFIIFQTVYCASAATIVSGAVAERTKFSTYLVISAILSAIVYPISGHWIWGGGWLFELGFHDFAGSTVIHMVGGAAALVGAKIVGPRIGKFTKDGKARAIPGQSLTLAALGMFILWWAWFGFNAGSSLTLSGDEGIVYTSDIFITTNLAAAIASIVTMCVTWVRYGKPDISLTISGALGGLVAITAGCDVVSPVGAVVIGAIAGVIIVFAVELMDNILKIDDPVGAVAVHGCCGAFGTLAVGFFDMTNGVLYGGSLHYLLIQCLGVATVLAYVLIVMTVVFTILKHTMGLRVSEEEEIVGLDIKEHGLISELTDATPALTGTSFKAKETTNTVVAPDVAVPVNYEVTNIDAPIKKVVIITKQTKFEALKHALDNLEITGMTVTQVLGCGIQKGAPEYYRGAPIEATLLPKVKVEIVISKVPVATLVGAAKEALYSGHIGDGKIFIYDVENVVKVRTGEEGYDALQGE